jgi:hypothetical protein
VSPRRYIAHIKGVQGDFRPIRTTAPVLTRRTGAVASRGSGSARVGDRGVDRRGGVVLLVGDLLEGVEGVGVGAGVLRLLDDRVLRRRVVEAAQITLWTLYPLILIDIGP